MWGGEGVTFHSALVDELMTNIVVLLNGSVNVASKGSLDQHTSPSLFSRNNSKTHVGQRTCFIAAIFF